MEILSSAPITTFAWYELIFIVGFAIGFVAAVWAYSDGSDTIGVSMITLALCCLIGGLCMPTTVPTGEYKYTVEITDESAYRELIEAGYSFSRVYPTRSIYEIVGEELP